MNKPEIIQFGEHGILLSWEKVINATISSAVSAANHWIQEKYGEELIETVRAYQSIAIYLKKDVDLSKFIAALSTETFPICSSEKRRRTIVVPVCYEGDYAADLNELAKRNSLNRAEVVELHTQAEYKVEFIGFLPGFPYLSGLNSQLYAHRRKTPTAHIVKGSVAIGGEQTGIYTQDSPGGWLVIGRSPLEFFSVGHNPPSILIPGDILRFRAIETEEYLIIARDVIDETYKLEEEVADD